MTLRHLRMLCGLCIGLLLAASVARGADTEPPPRAVPSARPPAAATFAGGCFWCMERPFDEVTGVTSTTAGYTGGFKKDPTYEEVSAGTTDHVEAVRVVYDPAVIDYARLLDVFWHNVDPTTPERQFCDVGRQYRSVIFYHDESQRRLAEASRQALEDAGRFKAPLATEIVPATTFYPAEGYHQDYYRKNPVRYRLYRYGCGRDARLKQIWGDDAASHE